MTMSRDEAEATAGSIAEAYHFSVDTRKEFIRYAMELYDTVESGQEPDPEDIVLPRNMSPEFDRALDGWTETVWSRQRIIH